MAAYNLYTTPSYGWRDSNDIFLIACDSRTRGTIPRRMILGKAVLIWSPLRRIRVL
jgi:hypothetical protein